MNHPAVLMIGLAACLLLADCKTKVPAGTGPQTSPPGSGTSTPLPGTDNSKTALDWAGTYLATTPCADCAGIHTTITLSNDLQYKIDRQYIGKRDSSVSSSGSFKWNEAGSEITLEGAEMGVRYLVGENTLTQLDREGKKITGNLASRYVFSKSHFDITQKYWRLIELNGSPVVMDSTMGREPHMILKAGNVQGNGGCNGFGGNFEVYGFNTIRFSRIISTQMACDGLQIENRYFGVLRIADSYYHRGDTLILNRARTAPLARFVAVYMK